MKREVDQRKIRESIRIVLDEDCVKMRKSAKELNVQLCDGYKLYAEILVNYTEKGKQVMILDLGALVSLAGKEWMDQYLKDHELEIGDMKTSECHQIFRFGPSTLVEQ